MKGTLEKLKEQSRRDFLKTTGIVGFGGFTLNLLSKEIYAKESALSIAKK